MANLPLSYFNSSHPAELLSSFMANTYLLKICYYCLFWTSWLSKHCWVIWHEF